MQTMDIITLLGFIAASLTTFSFLPQLLAVVKTRHTKDISLGMYILFSLGISMWLIYGIMRQDVVIISANTITLAFSTIILIYKLKYK
jgi:MtN3 and saliva related transmembrane protein